MMTGPGGAVDRPLSLTGAYIVLPKFVRCELPHVNGRGMPKLRSDRSAKLGAALNQTRTFSKTTPRNRTSSAVADVLTLAPEGLRLRSPVIQKWGLIEHFTDFACQRLRCEGLGQERCARPEQAVTIYVGTGVAGHVEHLHLRVQMRQP